MSKLVEVANVFVAEQMFLKEVLCCLGLSWWA